MWWLYGSGIALFAIDLFILSVNLSSRTAPSSWWPKVGFLLVALAVFAAVTIPGALLAMRHPWGACFRVLAEQRYAHPRFYGLAQVWAGLVVSGSMGANLFAPLFASLPYWVLAMYLAALAPLLTLYLFDRRR
jgi:hypothetical protein